MISSGSARSRRTTNVSGPLSRGSGGVSPFRSFRFCIGITCGIIIFLYFCFVRQTLLNNPSTEQTKQSPELKSILKAKKDVRSVKVEVDEDWVILETSKGNIHIHLRPDLSPESVDYVRQLIQSKTCSPCKFYRSEKGGILQGIMKSETVPHNKVRAKCPHGEKPKNPDKCHGPIMTRGMVGWAGGGPGPNFFLDMYDSPADFWDNDHTVWGEVLPTDDASLETIEYIFDQPTKKEEGGDMSYLEEEIPFTINFMVNIS